MQRQRPEVEPDQGDFALLVCLQQHRQKLAVSCRKVLTDHGH